MFMPQLGDSGPFLFKTSDCYKRAKKYYHIYPTNARIILGKNVK
jgi:hypothetical protein